MKCYACGQRMNIGTPVYTADDNQQEQLVGPDCYLHTKAAGPTGWQPPQGGPRLFQHKADAATADGVQEDQRG
jgi:hypothetical protein